MFGTGLLSPLLAALRTREPPTPEPAPHSNVAIAESADKAAGTIAVPPPADPSAHMRAFHSIEEFDAFDREIRANGDKAMVQILSNTYYSPPDLYEMPEDPFSEAYTEAVLRIHANISGHPHYDAATMEATPTTYNEMIATPAAYANGGASLGGYLESYGHVIQKLEVQPGMSVVEFGCGDAEISLHLARAGCAVTVVDIEQTYIDVVKEKASRLHIPIEAICASFGADIGPRAFDRAFFYQSFHHALDHRGFLAKLDTMLKPDAAIVFGPEPIIDPAGPWRHAVPYPWGPRLDGLSLRAMRSYGWMELGFQEDYFFEMLRRQGWTYDLHKSDTNGLVFSVVSKRRDHADQSSRVC